MAKFYITTPIYYPNDVPHIGHAYTTLVGDVLSRWQRMAGKDVFFLTGTDENAQKVFEVAQKKGEDPKQFVDELAVEFKKAFSLLNTRYDRFIRTTDLDHVAVVKKILTKAHENGDIYKGQYEGLYCVGCEAYFTEREAVEGKCPVHEKQLEVLKKDSYFFKLSKYRKQLLELYQEKPFFIMPPNRRQEVVSRVTEGLKDLSISREDYGWGIHLPFDEKHVCYVWYDALTNYLTGVGYADDGDNFHRYWPADVHIVGKDILWFHAVIWPAILMSVGIEVPHAILAHGWWTFDNRKIGKSVGKVIKVDELVAIAGVDSARYFLLRQTSFGEDGDFSEVSLIARHNNELANELGNLVSRLSTLIGKKCGGKIPDVTPEKIFSVKEIEDMQKLVDSFELNKVLDDLFILLGIINKYLNDKEPWKQTDQSVIDSVLYTCVDALRLVCLPLSAFIPSSCQKIRQVFGFGSPSFVDFRWGLAKSGIDVVKADVLFPKIEVVEKNIFPLHLKVGRILRVDPHPNADKLYVLHVDIGKEIQLVAGIREAYSPQELVGHHIVVVSNMKPAKLRGEKSEGMLLVGNDDDGMSLLTCSAAPGTSVTVNGYDINTAQITYQQFSDVTMSIKNGAIMYDSTPLSAGGKLVRVEKANSAKIE